MTAENEVESLSDTQVEENSKALEYGITNRQAKVKVKKVGDTSQRQKYCIVENTG